MPAHLLSGCRGRSCACVEKGNADLAPRECAVEYREIAHDHREEAKPCASFKRGKGARNLPMWRHVAEAKGEEVGPADIEIRKITKIVRQVVDWVPKRAIDEREPEDHSAG